MMKTKIICWSTLPYYAGLYLSKCNRKTLENYNLCVAIGATIDNKEIINFIFKGVKNYKI